MDTIYSQRTGQSPVSFAQPAPYNPMASQPARNRVNMAQLADYMKASRGMTPDAYAATQPGVQQGGMDVASLANQAQQDNQNITRPDYDINPQQPQQPMAPQGIDVNSLLSQITGAGSLAGIQAGAPQDQPNGAQPGPEVFQNEQTMGQAGLLPTSAPKEISQNPTNNVTQFSQNAVQAGLNGVDLGFQARTPTNGMSAESQNLDAQRIKGDMTSIAQAKDPKAAWQEVKKDPFYKDSNFYTGMMNVGLAIMSGANPMQAFQAGSQAMTNADMKEQLKGNREYLMQMYTPDSIAAATASGDPTLLKQKTMSQEDQMKAQSDEWTRRNAITSGQEDTRNAKSVQQSLDAEQRRYNQQNQIQQNQFNQQKKLLSMKNDIKQKAAQDAANSFDFTSRDLNAEKNTPEGSVIKSWSVKQGYFDAAKKDLDLAKQAIQNGDQQAATAAFKQAVFNSARGEIGENRSLQGSDLAEFAEDPNIAVRTINDIRLKSGFTPTLKAINYVDSANEVGSKSAVSNIERIKNQRIEANSRTLGARKATALVNRAFGGGWHDPLKAFAQDGDDAVNARTGGALSNDASWMYNN